MSTQRPGVPAKLSSTSMTSGARNTWSGGRRFDCSEARGAWDPQTLIFSGRCGANLGHGRQEQRQVRHLPVGQVWRPLWRRQEVEPWALRELLQRWPHQDSEDQCGQSSLKDPGRCWCGHCKSFFIFLFLFFLCFFSESWRNIYCSRHLTGRKLKIVQSRLQYHFHFIDEAEQVSISSQFVHNWLIFNVKF